MDLLDFGHEFTMSVEFIGDSEVDANYIEILMATDDENIKSKVAYVATRESIENIIDGLEQIKNELKKYLDK